MLEANHDSFDDETKIIKSYEYESKLSVTTKQTNVTENPFTIYVTGIDTYGSVSTVARSDVNLIVTVNPKTKQILMTSIPRDCEIQLHKNGKMDKLTHTGIYGTSETISTIEDFLDVEINYFARTNFSGMTNIVDALGGVTIDSDYKFTTLHGNYNIVKGENQMDGDKALCFVRERYSLPNGDFDRGKNQQKLLKAMDASDNDLLLFVSDAKYNVVCDALAALRNHLGKELKLFNPDEFAFLWVVDFPMFEYDDETERYYAVHHPFTRPKDSDIDKIENDPANCLADAYDIVLNGFELGGGSQRIYEQELQERAFRALGFTQERIDSQFGWFVEAFQYGTPPHGGFALGLDRLAMLLTGSENIREVIAFPKNASAVCPMSKAPSEVDNAQLEELGIAVIEDEQE